MLEVYCESIICMLSKMFITVLTFLDVTISSLLKLKTLLSKFCFEFFSSAFRFRKIDEYLNSFSTSYSAENQLPECFRYCKYCKSDWHFKNYCQDVNVRIFWCLKIRHTVRHVPVFAEHFSCILFIFCSIFSFCISFTRLKWSVFFGLFLQHDTFLAFKSIYRSFLLLSLFFDSAFHLLQFIVFQFSVPLFLSVRLSLKCINFHFDVSSKSYIYTTCFLRFSKDYLFICNLTCSCILKSDLSFQNVAFYFGLMKAHKNVEKCYFMLKALCSDDI